MTELEAFEKWRESHGINRPYTCMEAWISACKYQKEKDALIVLGLPILADLEKSCCGDIPEKILRSKIATAIREQEKG